MTSAVRGVVSHAVVVDMPGIARFLLLIVGGMRVYSGQRLCVFIGAARLVLVYSCRLEDTLFTECIFIASCSAHRPPRLPAVIDRRKCGLFCFFRGDVFDVTSWHTPVYM